MLRRRNFEIRDRLWFAMYSLILVSWSALFALHLSVSDLKGLNAYGFDYFWEMCSLGPENSSFAVVFGMWAAMAAAMMLPGFFPALSTFDNLIGAGAAHESGFLKLIAGYLGAWIGFSLAAALLQNALAMNTAYFSESEKSYNYAWASALFAVAGAYQFLPAKNHCLVKCRHPFPVIFEHWSEGQWNTLFIGFRLGIYCVGCCWALMALALAGGIISLAWMGLGTLLMSMEKLP